MSESEAWSEEDDAAVALELLPAWHPALFFDAFRIGMQNFHENSAAIARGGFVTPESREAWGDFTAVREFANSHLKISTMARWAIGAPDVAYVRLVDTEAWTSPVGRELPPAAAYATLVWRPEIAVAPGSSWRLHAIGAPLPPEEVPRSAHNFDPRKLP